MKRRILVVDDNEDCALTQATILRLRGHDVFTAGESKKALALIAEVRPDVVLLDIGLPGMNGFEVAAAIRKSPGAEDIKIIAVTGYGQREDRRLAREAGIDQLLVKPVDVSRLLEVIRKPRKSS